MKEYIKYWTVFLLYTFHIRCRILNLGPNSWVRYSTEREIWLHLPKVNTFICFKFKTKFKIYFIKTTFSTKLLIFYNVGLSLPFTWKENIFMWYSLILFQRIPRKQNGWICCSIRNNIPVTRVWVLIVFGWTSTKKTVSFPIKRCVITTISNQISFQRRVWRSESSIEPCQDYTPVSTFICRTDFSPKKARSRNLVSNRISMNSAGDLIRKLLMEVVCHRISCWSFFLV